MIAGTNHGCPHTATQRGFTPQPPRKGALGLGGLGDAAVRQAASRSGLVVELGVVVPRHDRRVTGDQMRF
ncbi:MAG: hypothetical protein LC777_07190 [Actinobacteria bacterium]|nr:hypothetical protein [Actinomycetota bacterium]